MERCGQGAVLLLAELIDEILPAMDEPWQLGYLQALASGELARALMDAFGWSSWPPVLWSTNLREEGFDGLPARAIIAALGAAAHLELFEDRHLERWSLKRLFERVEHTDDTRIVLVPSNALLLGMETDPRQANAILLMAPPAVQAVLLACLGKHVVALADYLKAFEREERLQQTVEQRQARELERVRAAKAVRQAKEDEEARIRQANERRWRKRPLRAEPGNANLAWQKSREVDGLSVSVALATNYAEGALISVKDGRLLERKPLTGAIIEICGALEETPLFDAPAQTARLAAASFAGVELFAELIEQGVVELDRDWQVDYLEALLSGALKTSWMGSFGWSAWSFELQSCLQNPKNIPPAARQKRSALLGRAAQCEVFEDLQGNRWSFEALVAIMQERQKAHILYLGTEDLRAKASRADESLASEVVLLATPRIQKLLKELFAHQALCAAGFVQAIAAQRQRQEGPRPLASDKPSVEGASNQQVQEANAMRLLREVRAQVLANSGVFSTADARRLDNLRAEQAGAGLLAMRQGDEIVLAMSHPGAVHALEHIDDVVARAFVSAAVFAAMHPGGGLNEAAFLAHLSDMFDLSSEPLPTPVKVE